MSKLKAVMAEFETKIRGAVIADLVGAAGTGGGATEAKPATAKRKYTRKAKPADASSAATPADPNAPVPAPKKRGRPKKSAAAPPATEPSEPAAEQVTGPEYDATAGGTTDTGG